MPHVDPIPEIQTKPLPLNLNLMPLVDPIPGIQTKPFPIGNGTGSAGFSAVSTHPPVRNAAGVNINAGKTGAIITGTGGFSAVSEHPPMRNAAGVNINAGKTGAIVTGTSSLKPLISINQKPGPLVFTGHRRVDMHETGEAHTHHGDHVHTAAGDDHNH